MERAGNVRFKKGLFRKCIGKNILNSTRLYFEYKSVFIVFICEHFREKNIKTFIGVFIGWNILRLIGIGLVYMRSFL